MGRSADVPRQAAGLVMGDDTGCSILHVDMDAFFASVEIKRQPHLQGRPVIVGGGTRGVVSVASYAARRFGVRSAMPIGQALRLCPAAIVLPPDRAAYTAASQQVMAILRDVTPLVEPLSLDEAFLDISGAQRIAGRPAEIAQTIRARVADEVGLTCSVGVASTKFVAKVASARCKPDGLLVVPAADVLDFLHPLPVTVLWGVGARTAQPLHALGVRTIGDLAAVPPDTLRRAVGTATAEHLAGLAAGRDQRSVHEREAEKSIGADRTYDTDLTELAEVRRELLRLADEVAGRLRAKGLAARTVGIKIRFADFRTVTRVRTLPRWVDVATDIYDTALELYDGLGLDRPRIRLVGVKGENFMAAGLAPEQLSLDWASPAPPPLPAVSTDSSALPGSSNSGRSRRTVAAPRAARDRAAVQAATDAVRARFGAGAVRAATLLPPGSGDSAPQR